MQVWLTVLQYFGNGDECTMSVNKAESSVTVVVTLEQDNRCHQCCICRLSCISGSTRRTCSSTGTPPLINANVAYVMIASLRKMEWFLLVMTKSYVHAIDTTTSIHTTTTATSCSSCKSNSNGGPLRFGRPEHAVWRPQPWCESCWTRK